jgi:hypothetical protein
MFNLIPKENGDKWRWSHSKVRPRLMFLKLTQKEDEELRRGTGRVWSCSRDG